MPSSGKQLKPRARKGNRVAQMQQNKENMSWRAFPRFPVFSYGHNMPCRASLKINLERHKNDDKNTSDVEGPQHQEIPLIVILS